VLTDATIVGRTDLLAEDHELVSRHSRERVADPNQMTESICHGEQQGVSDVMTVFVVHTLEPVEVDEQHSGLSMRSFGSISGVPESLIEQLPIGEAGEWIVERAVMKGVRRSRGLLAGIGVEDVRRGDVGQSLGRLHVARGQPAWRRSIQVEDALDREIGDHRAREFPQNCRQLVLVDHAQRLPTCTSRMVRAVNAIAKTLSPTSTWPRRFPAREARTSSPFGLAAIWLAGRAIQRL